MTELPEYIDQRPNICGSEPKIESALHSNAGKPVFLPESRIDFGNINSAFAIALHMHQPLIPAGGNDLATAEIISNLKYMMDNQGIGDNHNAPVFQWCYKRMGDFIPQLVDEGKQPRVMLEYSGTLLHGLRHMGLNDVLDNLKRITCDSRYRLICRNGGGEEVSIIAIKKTQGSDTKLVAQRQPYYEAKGLSRFEVGGKHIPPLVTQIADGENGGVMMNEFPGKYLEVMRES